MPEEDDRGDDASRPTVCEIRIRGHLGQPWQDWFLGLTILPDEDGTTLLTGPVVDQAALHGILKKVRDLGLPLISVNFVSTDRPESPGS
ncbi:MAG: hypothetical protein KIS95_04620 [Anaerolineae bacterium]|uniref:hypothetical protein n=1 Tax=Promineifilum sp. TaxID=2664178 RepID=UPI001DF12746|nr:hypothetical protein [Anaerolineales bacterium]MCB8935403.1 hypothetical protein [Promineifilum sp.]MCO5181553.1 hypothetical protein [Promineifilum sp.]MCW5846490.1 hypothetical protein [Anaerolineae bacterium]